MSHYKIIGQQPLEGILEVAGAKNHALKVIAASVLSDEPMTIHRVPAIEDVRRLLEILTSMGADITSDEVAGTLRIDTSGLRDGLMPSELTRRIRASAVLIGPLLARFGKVVIPHPGGCLLGKRPIDLFIDGFKALGADVLEDEHSVTFTAHRLVGATIFMPVKSVTVTETLMMAATLADGITILKNAACEPEIPALAEYLNEHGARISGAGTHTIRIIGVSRLSAGLCRVIPDRLETGTFAILAAAAR
jgi:UDP-N-acetylglucosamine 1-carboxyvinyltransferase